MRCFATEPTSHAPLSFFFHTIDTTCSQQDLRWCSAQYGGTSVIDTVPMANSVVPVTHQRIWLLAVRCPASCRVICCSYNDSLDQHFKINTHRRLSRCTSEKCDAKGRQPSTRHVTNARSSHKSLLETPGAIASGNWGDHHTSGLAQLRICSQAQIHPWSYTQELARHKSDTATTHIRAKCVHFFFLHYPRADRV